MRGGELWVMPCFVSWCQRQPPLGVRAKSEGKETREKRVWEMRVKVSWSRSHSLSSLPLPLPFAPLFPSQMPARCAPAPRNLAPTASSSRKPVRPAGTPLRVCAIAKPTR